LDLTRTVTTIDNRALGETQRHWCLRLIHHPEPSLIGLRYVFQSDQSIELGRGGAFAGRPILNIPSLSRNHVKVTAKDEGLHVSDMGSRNGTYIDGNRVTDAIASFGQTLGVGSLLFLVHRGPLLYDEPNNPRLIGCSWQIASILQDARLVALRDTTVTILGETGSGKEILANEIHRLSNLRGDMVPINCGALSDGVLQSELFGHVRGAFSGAGAQRHGLIRRAEHGTLFLDEVGDATSTMQVTLLRLLQERSYRPVGSDQERKTSARFIAATAPRVRDAVAEQRFREDLWMRLSRWVIDIPPLRQRPDDIHVLANHFTAKYAKPKGRLTAQFLGELCRHPWPGNVRELEGVIEAACVRAQGAEWIDGAGWRSQPGDTPSNRGAHTDNALQKGEPMVSSSSQDLPAHARAKRPKSAAELVALLKEYGGNVSAAARSVGVGRSTMYRWLQKHNVDPDELESP
jgi:DNA-binding NtrC family response regulator